jgi:hypothetical protein
VLVDLADRLGHALKERAGEQTDAVIGEIVCLAANKKPVADAGAG